MVLLTTKVHNQLTILTSKKTTKPVESFYVNMHFSPLFIPIPLHCSRYSPRKIALPIAALSRVNYARLL